MSLFFLFLFFFFFFLFLLSFLSFFQLFLKSFLFRPPNQIFNPFESLRYVPSPLSPPPSLPLQSNKYTFESKLKLKLGDTLILQNPKTKAWDLISPQKSALPRPPWSHYQPSPPPKIPNVAVTVIFLFFSFFSFLFFSFFFFSFLFFSFLLFILADQSIPGLFSLSLNYFFL